MMNNGKRYISFVTLLAIAIFLAINIHDSEAKKLTVPELRELMGPKGKTCVSKTGISQDMVDRAGQNGEFPADPLLQAYYGCLFKSLKVVGKDGKIDLNAVFKQLDFIAIDYVVKPMKEILGECHSKLTTDELNVAAWEMAKCCYTSNPELHFLP